MRYGAALIVGYSPRWRFFSWNETPRVSTGMDAMPARYLRATDEVGCGSADRRPGPVYPGVVGMFSPRMSAGRYDL